jgi:hypothetical protein
MEIDPKDLIETARSASEEREQRAARLNALGLPGMCRSAILEAQTAVPRPLGKNAALPAR